MVIFTLRISRFILLRMKKKVGHGVGRDRPWCRVLYLTCCHVIHVCSITTALNWLFLGDTNRMIAEVQNLLCGAHKGGKEGGREGGEGEREWGGRE